MKELYEAFLLVNNVEAAWPNGKAEDCKSFTPSSNLGVALTRLNL